MYFFPIDLFDIVESRFVQDRDHAKLEGQWLDWFSTLRDILRMYWEPAGNLTTCAISCILTNFVVNTSQNTYKN